MPIDSPTPTRAAHDALQSRYAGLTARQARAVQKELLVARAALERLSIAEAGADLRGQFSGFGVLGLLGRVLGRGRRGGDTGLSTLLGLLPGFMQPAAQALLPVLSRHPLVAGLLSLLMQRGGGGALQRAGKSAKWAGIAVMGLKAFGWARRAQSWRAQRHARKHPRPDAS